MLLSERQRRFQESQQPIEAAKVALDRLRLAPDTDSQISHSTVFDLISEASVQRLASELRRTEPSSDWHAWLSLNRAFRQGRPALLRWIAEHPVLQKGETPPAPPQRPRSWVLARGLGLAGGSLRAAEEAAAGGRQVRPNEYGT